MSYGPNSSMHTFVRSSIYKDLLTALEAEWYLHFSNYLGAPRLPTQDTDRYTKIGYPAPQRKNCWCPSDSDRHCPTQQLRRVRVGMEQCRNKPWLELGEDFGIDKCEARHCSHANCFQWSDVVAPWVRTVLYAQEAHMPTVKVSRAVLREAAKLVAEYGNKVGIDEIVDIICVVIQNFHEPSASLGIRWMPELHGVTWLHEISRSEVARGIFTRMRHAKEAREGAGKA